MWYNINNTRSRNCLFNFVIGNRGGGKTYGFKEWAIKDFLKSSRQFIYVRRYRQEFKKISTFFDDIKGAFPEQKFEVKGLSFLIDGKTAGFALALSTAKVQKSTSFPKVNKICFDEFILDKGVYHYLPDEVTAFLELYETIARMRDVPVFFLSNAITVTNPYFMYFDVGLPYGKKVSCKDDILIELVQDAEYIETKSQTRFAKIVEGTQYGNYAIENQFLRDNKNFVQKKTPGSEYYFTFLYNGDQYGVWVDYTAGVMTVSENVDPSCLRKFALTTDDHRPNTLFLKNRYQQPHFKNFVDQYKLGNVRFESINIKNICYQIIKSTL